MTVLAIIQARMGSTRLPGKILKQVNGKALLAYQLERVGKSKFIDQIVIATTIDQKDDQIVEFCIQYGVDYYRGSENDVLARYYEAAEQFDGDIIVRLTSDCPIIDPVVIDETINYYIDHSSEFDYVSNTIERTYPRGLDTEVFSRDALEKSNEKAKLERDREHVTAFMYSNPQIFRIGSISNTQNLENHRWTVDTAEDFQLVDLILSNLYSKNQLFYMSDVIELLDKHPDWVQLNSHIEQKKL
ncbi:acylneuraminate cytidylyltransferase [Viridibacillus sp. FSL H7-0596]|uniref:cytidylyltransferase domain-containing protein n=1 Tax=Viridibacillus sp. FSL H7-0596 TaxID=1928923 RepID=UPI00096E53B3|nr:glycosyltransferase family protein [Viridibacillus sp. FSL H7-0596]OMC89147.1 acylneuraminate cytidylyltransferase [Viridibacillus sp. FSL H7-0596]